MKLKKGIIYKAKIKPTYGEGVYYFMLFKDIDNINIKCRNFEHVFLDPFGYVRFSELGGSVLYLNNSSFYKEGVTEANENEILTFLSRLECCKLEDSRDRALDLFKETNLNTCKEISLDN